MTPTVLAATGEAAKSGPIGLAVILVLCVACYFLFKSMSKHMRKVREEFPGSEAATDEQSPTADAQPDGVDLSATPASLDTVPDTVPDTIPDTVPGEPAGQPTEQKAAPEA